MVSLNEQNKIRTLIRKLAQQKRIKLPSLGLRVSERRLLLIFIDLLLLNTSLITGLILLADVEFNLAVLWDTRIWYISLSIIWLTFATIFDVYNLARAASPTHSARSAATTAFLTTALYSALPFVTPQFVRRSQAYLLIALAVLLLILWRHIYARLFVQPVFQRRTLIVGAGQSGQSLATMLQSVALQHDGNPFKGTGYILVGFVDDALSTQQEQIAGLPLLGNADQLVSLVNTHRIDELIMAITHVHTIRRELFDAVLDCREIGIPITAMTTVYERLTGRVAIDHASQNIELAVGQQDNPFARLSAFFKRLLDLIGGLLGTLLLLPLLPLVALGNKLASPGPLFFRQQRVGQGGQLYNVIKFRSMIPNAEKGRGATWAEKHDDRITPFGHWLRQSHLDELPQVINVLRGEMSLVGPRPERPEFVQTLTQQIPFYRARHATRPGITGWAQIHQDYGDSLEGAKEKLEYDLYYIKRTNPILDLRILLRTIAKVIGLRGR